MKFEINLKKNKDIDYSNKSSKIQKEMLNKTGLKAYTSVKDKTPKRTGELRGAWSMTKNSQQVKIQNKLPYALYLAAGTGIYGNRGAPIFPKTAPFLQFEIDGQIIRTLSVKGIKPVKMAEKTIDEIEKQLPVLWSETIERCMK